MRMAIRKNATFYDDQYKFYKELKSEKLMIAFVEYMFEWIEPKWLNSLEQTVFDSLKVRMDNQKKKSNAWAKSHWWWRPQKQTENNETTSKKTTEKQQKNNTKTTEQTTEKQEVKVKDKVKDISISRSISNTNISISKDIETETKVSEYWNQEINLCLEIISKYNWWIIDWTKQNQRRYGKLLIDKLKKLESIKNGKYTWEWTLEIILKIISDNKFYSNKITSPENIYRNLAVLMQQCKKDIGKQQANNTVLEVI